MSAEIPKHDHILTVFAFLGSATFTALFFLLQAKDIVKDYNFFVASVAIASILFIILVVARLNISTGRIRTDTSLAKIVSWLGVFGFLWILIILILLLMEINRVVGIIVGVCSLTFYIVVEIAARKSKPSW